MSLYHQTSGAPVEVQSVNVQRGNPLQTVQPKYIIRNGKLVWADPRIYLESDGNQYINTNIIAEDDTYECKFSNMELNPLSAIFGSSSSYNYSLAIYHTDVRYCLPNKMYIGPSTTIDLYTDKVICSDDGVYSENYSYSLASDFNGGSGNMNLFRGAGQSKTSKGRIHFFKWTKTNGLFMHLVPVPAGLQIGNFTVPSNGMFDMVTQTFFGNAGSGNFTIGIDE